MLHAAPKSEILLSIYVHMYMYVNRVRKLLSIILERLQKGGYFKIFQDFSSFSNISLRNLNLSIDHFIIRCSCIENFAYVNFPTRLRPIKRALPQIQEEEEQQQQYVFFAAQMRQCHKSQLKKKKKKNNNKC